MTTADLVPADRAREHVRTLVAGGMRRIRIAEAANVSPSTITHLLTVDPRSGGPKLTLQADTEARLLAVTLVPREPKTQCLTSEEFEDVDGYRVGRCVDCGELAPVHGGRLITHPTRRTGGEA